MFVSDHYAICYVDCNHIDLACGILFGAGDMFLHVVQSTLSDPLLQDQVLELMAVAVVLDAGSDLAEAVQEDLIVCAMLLIIPAGQRAKTTTSEECQEFLQHPSLPRHTIASTHYILSLPPFVIYTYSDAITSGL